MVDHRTRRTVADSDAQIRADAQRLAESMYGNMMAFVQGAFETLAQTRGEACAAMVKYELHLLMSIQPWDDDGDQGPVRS